MNRSRRGDSLTRVLNMLVWILQSRHHFTVMCFYKQSSAAEIEFMMQFMSL